MLFIRIYKKFPVSPALSQKVEPSTINKKTTPIGIFFEINGLKYENMISGPLSVYSFMENLQNNGKITFKDKTYSGMGKLIESINGVKNGGEKNWIYYVNGKKATIGVSNYQINNGDIVSWHYEKSY